MAVYNSQNGKKIRHVKGDFLHPLKLGFLGSKYQLAILGKYVFFSLKNRSLIVPPTLPADKWEPSVIFVDEENEVSHCVGGNKGRHRFRSPNGLVGLF